MLLSRIVATGATVGTTRSRQAKTDAIAATLTAVAADAPDEVAAATAMLAGSPRQAPLGTGWATLRKLDATPADTPTLHVCDVDAALDSLAGIHGAGSVARRRDLLTDLYGRATANEQTFLTAFILQHVRQGALDGVVTAAIAQATDIDPDVVQRAAMLTGDLPTTAALALCEGEDALRAVGLKVGRPLQPMLASSAADTQDALAMTGPARVDRKLDGMRIQVHRDGEVVQVFSRGLRDVTEQVPAVVAAVADLPCTSVVLDGEALAVDDTGRPLAFQDSMASDRLRPWFFDILHCDGVDLLDAPLSTRLSRLHRLAGDLAVPGQSTSDPDAATEILRDTLAAGHEGIVVKALDSIWQAGRRGADWVKVKVAHTLDLVVLAAEWGSGRRQGWLSNLHLGARDVDSGEFVMLGKTFKGMTDDMLTWQTEQFLELEVDRTAHVVHLRPELVVEIAFDGVQRSTRYPGGVALRFARVKGHRPDKPAAEADTLQTVRAILNGEVIPEV